MEHLIAESSGDNDDNNHPPPYPTPITYEEENWSLAGARWGDTECLEIPTIPKSGVEGRYAGLLSTIMLSTTKDTNLDKDIQKIIP